MSMIAAALRELISAGITGDQLVAAIERIEAAAKPARSSHAEAQARYRERNKNKQSQVITGDHADHCDVAAPSPDKERSPTPPKEINPYPSETNVSGVAAPNVIVLPDPRADLFSRGIQTVAAMTGKPDPQCRGLVGRWLKLANDDAVRVLRTIEDAARNRVADAVPWIEAALKAPKQSAQAKPDWLLHKEKMQRWV